MILPATPAGNREIIHLILDHQQNRRLLAEALTSRYHISLPSKNHELQAAFDLAIIDVPALCRIHKGIASRKAEEAIFLPFLLVADLPYLELDHLHLWQSIDEILPIPVRKLELRARIEMLLRARRFSREAEHRFFSLAQTAPVGIFIVQNSRLTKTNSIFDLMLGGPCEGKKTRCISGSALSRRCRCGT